MLFSAAARAVATSLLEFPGARGADGETPPAADAWNTSSGLLPWQGEVGTGVGPAARHRVAISGF